MSNKCALHCPYNSVSFGQVSTAITREIYRQGLSPCIFPIGGQIDLNCQKKDPDFSLWLQSCLNRAHKHHNRNDTAIHLWHCNGLMESFSKEQVAITFLETDTCSETEANILNQQKVTFVTSNFTKQVMEEAGVKNVKYLELGFDKDNFYDTKKTYLNPDVIVFGLGGKLEILRKAHEKVLKGWVKKYGNQREYMLHAAIFNPFLRPEDQQNILNNIFEGKRYWNVNFLPYMQTNSEYNDFINSVGIMLALSRGEGRDLPVFHAVGLSKHCVGLRAHSYLDYLNNENATLIDPKSKIRAIDNLFFHENPNWNTGNFFDWEESDFLDACDVAVNKYKQNKINAVGLELQKRTYKDTVETILKEV